MNNYHRMSALAAAVAITISGAALAEGTSSSSPPQHTTSFLGWLWSGSTTAVVAAKPRSAGNKLAERPASSSATTKPNATCTLLPCVILVGIGF